MPRTKPHELTFDLLEHTYGVSFFDKVLLWSPPEHFKITSWAFGLQFDAYAVAGKWELITGERYADVAALSQGVGCRFMESAPIGQKCGAWWFERPSGERLNILELVQPEPPWNRNTLEGDFWITLEAIEQSLRKLGIITGRLEAARSYASLFGVNVALFRWTARDSCLDRPFLPDDLALEEIVLRHPEEFPPEHILDLR